MLPEPWYSPAHEPPGSSTTEQVPSSAQHAPLGAAGVKFTTSSGRFSSVPFSRLSKRLAVSVTASFPIRIHPNSLDGSSIQACTSATRPGVEPQV
jgi:hypothetical protein